jgi:uncharacterized protein (DUF2345 family)
VQKDLKEESKQNVSIKAQQNITAEAQQSVSVKGGTQVTIEAQSTLTLKCGPSKVELGPSGVTVSGPTISLG